MIDAENEIFSTVSSAIKLTYSAAYVTSEYVAKPAKFPCASLVEEDNSTYERGVDSGGEHHANVMYTANVYSDLSSGKKVQCKAIMAIIDTEMLKMGFSRLGKGPAEMPNSDKSVYRIVARYRAVISEGLTVYRK